MESSEPFVLDRLEVRGHLHAAEGNARGSLVLAHGAGSNSGSPLLAAAGATFSRLGWNVLRCDLPFRQRRPSGPPSPGDAARDRIGLRNAASAMRERFPGLCLLGGHSYGGRMAAILASEDASVADALLLFSYPLHPPGRREQTRTAHFPRLGVPAVFVHGTRDPFGSIEEMELALGLIPAPKDLVVVEGGAHDLRRGRKLQDVMERAAGVLVRWFPPG